MADATTATTEATEGYTNLTDDGGVQIKVHSEGNGTKPRTGEEVIGELTAPHVTSCECPGLGRSCSPVACPWTGISAVELVEATWPARSFVRPPSGSCRNGYASWRLTYK